MAEREELGSNLLRATQNNPGSQVVLDTPPPKISLPAVSYLGRVSYSVYFIHAMILDFIFKTTDAMPGQLPLYFLLTVAISSLTYFLIEEPFNKLARQLLPFNRQR
jgi:peptidoglycan/LPS O-acetylase OafA/YrhL